MARKTREQFIEEAIMAHGDKYDYSEVEYVGTHTKVKIICFYHGRFWQRPCHHIRGQGCKKCGRNKVAKQFKLSDIEFINRLHIVHGDKYDYSKVKYINRHTKIEIICPKHNSFWQRAGCHLGGQGCPKCKGGVLSNKNEFIKKSIKVHGNKYDYSLVEYKNCKTLVKIICLIHGVFEQTPDAHVSGKGCGKCVGFGLTTEELIKKYREVHGDKYDYSKVVYTTLADKILIGCPEHGFFEQTAKHHFIGCGCKHCSGCAQKNTQIFINEAQNIHGNLYDYSKVVYINNKTKVKIICHKHGMFEKKPKSHLKGVGCPRCNNSISKLSQKWLDGLNISQEYRERTLKIGKKQFRLDAFDKENNIIYEFDGDFWHGNPEIFDQDEINPICKVTYGELYQKTLEKKEILENAGYKVISIWENDYNKQHK